MTIDDSRHLLERQPSEALASLANFDEADYRSYLESLEISERQKSELMRIVWDIMRMWVEMDLPAESCGQILDCIFNSEAADSARVE